MRRPRIRMQTNGAGEAQISILGPIGPLFWGDEVSLGAVREALAQVGDSAQIRVLLNSPGGDAFEGMAIYNILAKERERLTVEVLGIAASAASLIALAGHELIMDEGSYLMIHEPWGMTAGPADDHRKTADVLDKMTGNFADLYAGHSDLRRDEALVAMKAETWYTAAEAVDAGFADGVGDGGAIAASAEDLARFKYQHAPAELAQFERKPNPPSTPRDLEGALREAGYSKTIAEGIVKRGFSAVREGVTDETDVGSTSTTTVAAAASAKGKRRDTIECTSMLAEIQQLQKGVRK